MTQYVLLRHSTDYADEFDVSGLAVITVQAYKKSLEELKLYFEKYPGLCWYFGTNEFIEYTSEEDVLGAYDIIQLTEKEYEFFKKYNITDFGHTGPLPNLDSSFEQEGW